MTQKRAYWISSTYEDDGYGVIIIGESVQYVKKNWWWYFDGDYVDFRVRWLKDVKPKQLEDIPCGELDPKIGLRLREYGWIEDDCDKCDIHSNLVNDFGDLCLCDECNEKEWESRQKNVQKEKT